MNTTTAFNRANLDRRSCLIRRCRVYHCLFKHSVESSSYSPELNKAIDEVHTGVFHIDLSLSELICRRNWVCSIGADVTLVEKTSDHAMYSLSAKPDVNDLESLAYAKRRLMCG